MDHDAPKGAFAATAALIATAIVCSVVVIASPRPVEPSRLPALRLDRAEVQAQLATDRALATRAPRGPEIEALLSLYEAEGRSELAQAVDFEEVDRRRRELAGRAPALFARIGQPATRALMAQVTERAMAALREGRDGEPSRALLGNFPQLLVRYGYRNRAGVLVAPELAVRALYKVRFNLIVERPLVADLSPIELQAYEGWNALSAAGIPAERRALAARAFYQASGVHSREALAIWRYQAGAREEAAALLRAEYARTGELRLRNMLLFAQRR